MELNVVLRPVAGYSMVAPSAIFVRPASLYLPTTCAPTLSLPTFGRVSYLSPFPRSLYSMRREVKFHVHRTPLYRLKACLGVLRDSASLGYMYQGSSFGVDVRQVRSSFLLWYTLDINLVT